MLDALKITNMTATWTLVLLSDKFNLLKVYAVEMMAQKRL
jgi:hypothetical protein